jgi:uncharacterized protein YbaR (Trm112 family)
MLQEQIDQTDVTHFEPLQAIVCCPASKSSLKLVQLAQLLERLPEGGREPLPEGMIGAFVSESSLKAYPIIGGIVDFLDQDALSLSKEQALSTQGSFTGDTAVKQRVKDWYDQFGWKRHESGLYNDTRLFSQDKPVGFGLYELLSHVSVVEQLSEGDFVLDAASGPIPHQEKLTHSWFYKYRVCVDISLTALEEAHAKISGRGFCCMADICRLPFRDNVFDGVVSGYTIQHIPETDQAQAVKEVYGSRGGN